MACRYVFTEEEIKELTNAAKVNKRKDVDRRLQALLMRAKGNKLIQQGMKSSNNTNSLGRANRYLVIFGKTAGIVELCQRTLNNPSLGQNLPPELMGRGLHFFWWHRAGWCLLWWVCLPLQPLLLASAASPLPCLRRRCFQYLRLWWLNAIVTIFIGLYSCM